MICRQTILLKIFGELRKVFIMVVSFVSGLSKNIFFESVKVKAVKTQAFQLDSVRFGLLA